jgi:hypothetical protein
MALRRRAPLLLMPLLRTTAFVVLAAAIVLGICRNGRAQQQNPQE